MYRDNENTIVEGVKNRLKENNINIRSNAKHDSIVALEYVLTISPEWWKETKEIYSDESALGVLAKFVSERHGENNIVSAAYHFDETTPHVHVVCTPIEDKTITYRNRHGAFTKTKATLRASDYTNFKQQYRDLQTDYHEYVNDWSKERFNIEITRGIDAREQKRKYIQSTIQEIGVIQKETIALTAEIKKAAIDLKNGIINASQANQVGRETSNSILENSNKVMDKVETIKKTKGELAKAREQNKGENWKKNRHNGIENKTNKTSTPILKMKNKAPQCPA